MRVTPGRCLLRQLLIKRGMTQAQLADLMGVAEQKISNYVTGQAKMGYTTALTVAYILGVHAEELYEQIIER